MRTRRWRESPLSSARAHAERPRLHVAGELAAGRFVARVLTLDGDHRRRVERSSIRRARSPAAIAVLVISCPCAFALAVPAAHHACARVPGALGRAGREAGCDPGAGGGTHVLFDKTGTLTEPELALGDVTTFDGVSREAALSLAATLGRESRHPVARAIAAAARQSHGRSRRTDVTSHAGLGISGRVAHRELRLGQAAFALPASLRRAGQTTPCCSLTLPVRSPPSD